MVKRNGVLKPTFNRTVENPCRDIIMSIPMTMIFHTDDSCVIHKVLKSYCYEKLYINNYLQVYNIFIQQFTIFYRETILQKILIQINGRI